MSKIGNFAPKTAPALRPTRPSGASSEALAKAGTVSGFERPTTEPVAVAPLSPSDAAGETQHDLAELQARLDDEQRVPIDISAVSDRAPALIALLREALGRTDELSTHLRVLLSFPQHASDGELTQQIATLGAELSQTTLQIQALREEQRALLSAIETSFRSGSEAEKQLEDSLSHVLSGHDYWAQRDPQGRLREVGDELARLREQLEHLGRARKTLEQLPLPVRGLADAFGSFSGGLNGGLRGAMNGGFSVGALVSEADRTGQRAYTPFVSVGASIPLGSAGYTRSANASRTGFGWTASIIPYSNIGASRFAGRFVSVNIPGLFGVSLRERGELSIGLNFPIHQFQQLTTEGTWLPGNSVASLNAGLQFSVGHPAAKAVTTPAFDAVDRIQLSIEEFAARLSNWARSQLDPANS
jgi:hypothetical protein